jgi:hypothetical protein
MASKRNAALEAMIEEATVDALTGDSIVAICGRGRDRERIDLLDLPLPTPPPDGADWIDAYRHWAGR